MLDRHRAARQGRRLRTSTGRCSAGRSRTRCRRTAPGYYLIARLDGSDVAGDRHARTGVDRGVEHLRRGRRRRHHRGCVTAGGRSEVTSSPQDAGPAADGAGFVDPTGAPFRVWQPRRRLGAQVVNAPGAWNFSDLHTSDPDGAKAFYGAVFGWEADELDFGDGEGRRCGVGRATATISRRRSIPTSTSARRASRHHRGSPTRSRGWLRSTEDEVPHWHVTFAVADRDEMVASALRLGRDRSVRPDRQRLDQVGGRARPAGRHVHVEPVRPASAVGVGLPTPRVAHRESAKPLMSRTVAMNTSGIAARKIMSPAWQVPFTVRLTADTPASSELAVVGQTLVAQGVELVHRDHVRRQAGEVVDGGVVRPRQWVGGVVAGRVVDLRQPAHHLAAEEVAVVLVRARSARTAVRRTRSRCTDTSRRRRRSRRSDRRAWPSASWRA